MKSSFYLLILLFLPVIVKAGSKPEYAADKIDKALLANANAVIRLSEQEVTIKDLDNVTIQSHIVITILKKEGDEYALLKEAFSKLASIEKLAGYLYDKAGNQQLKIKEGDFKTFTISQNAGYYDDDKVRVYKASYREYPYTVEFFSEIKQSHSFYLPIWEPRPEYDISVEQSTYKVNTPRDIPIRYKSVNASLTPNETVQENTRSYSWKIDRIAAERNEFMASDEYKGSPVVLVAPTSFKLAGYTGDMRDWKSMGAFIYELGRGRDQLTEDKRATVKELTSSIGDSKAKIRALYKYMQEHTRYVSIQYGVGGWQTLDAKFVSENQYGDCKALSNYMLSLLKEAGIVSYPVIICAGRAGFEKMPRDFAVNIFNHEILCVPLGKDTVWLECTSKDMPMNFLSSFTADRDGLMITPDGGFVIHTPRYDTTVNIISRKAIGKCMDDGSIAFKLSSFYSGIPAEKLTRWPYMTEQEKDQFIHSKLHLSSYQANDYQLDRNDKDGTLSLEENMSVVAGNMINKVGGYQLVDIDLCPISLPFQLQVTERRKNFAIDYSYQVRDTFEIALNPGVNISELPHPVASSSPFGRYELFIKASDGKLTAVRNLTLLKGEYRPEQYTEYESWLDLINQEKNYGVVLESK